MEDRWQHARRLQGQSEMAFATEVRIRRTFILRPESGKSIPVLVITRGEADHHQKVPPVESRIGQVFVP